MTTRNGIFAFVAAAVLAPAATEAADDPFASQTPLAEAELEEARGGMIVAGFVVDFGFDASLVHNAPAGAAGFSYSFDPLLNTFVIDNMLDGVVAKHTMTLDVAIPNFDMRIDQAAAALGAVDAAVDAILLAPLY